MSTAYQSPVEISVFFCTEHIPARGRKPKLSWTKEVVPTVVRRCSLSDLALAYRIHQRADRHAIRVFTDGGDLWWPVGHDGSETDAFLRNLRNGYPDVVGLIGTRIRVSYAWHQERKIESREVIRSWRDDAIVRAHQAAQNVMLVDEQVFIRGGRPLFMFHGPNGAPETPNFKVFNAGFEYGRPLPTALSGSGAYFMDELNLLSFVAGGQVLSLDQTREYGDHGNAAPGIEIQLDIDLPAFDLPEYQMQLLCRDLFETVDDNTHLPLEVRRRGLALHRLSSQVKPSLYDCVQAVIDLRGWLSDLEPSLRSKFRKTERLLKSRIPYIERSCRLQGRASVFAMSSADDESIASLLVL